MDLSLALAEVKRLRYLEYIARERAARVEAAYHELLHRYYQPVPITEVEDCPE